MKLPLLMTGFVAVMLVVILALTYVTLARSAMAAARFNLERVGSQLGTMARDNVSRHRAAAAGTAGDPVIRRTLAAAAAGSLSTVDPAELDRVRERLDELLAESDSTLAAQLWSADGRLVASVGRGGAEGATAGAPGDRAQLVPGFPVPEGLKSVASGDLYLVGGEPRFWMVAPVSSDGRTLGYVARQHRIAGGPRVEAAIRGLTGANVDTYYRTTDGRRWMTLAARPATAPAADDSADGKPVVVRPDVGRLLTTEVPIDGSPLVLVAERSEASVLAAPRAAMRRLAAVSVVLMMVGVVAAWFTSRRITRPLVELTAATASVARGNYDTRVHAGGGEELARLADSFNTMAAEVGAAHAELEVQTEEAQAAAEELAAAREEADEARVQAEKANRAKSEFLAVMSHELRTPLNAIGGYTELLELGLRGPVTDAQRRDLDRIRVNQQHLLGLISGVLDLSRIEAGRVSYNLVAVPLREFLMGLNSLVEPQAIAKSLTLDYLPCDGSLGVTADREKLRQVLLNLLSNAIRYTPAGGRVALSASATGDGRVAIAVSDTGVGISAEALEEIFQPFVQLDRSLTRIREGVGLGLAISLDLARGMAGDIVVESSVGEGSRFTLLLPLATLDAAALALATSGEYPLPEAGDVTVA